MVLPAPNFNHVAISVPDAAAAVKWYTEVLGFRVLVPLSTSKPAGAKGPLVTAIYGEELKEMKLAILTGGNDIGVEIFQFVDPPYDGPAERESWGPRTYTRGGFFHICITVPNVEEYQQMIVAAGGKLCGSMTEPGDGQKAATALFRIYQESSERSNSEKMHSIAAFALVAAITLFFVHKKIFKRSKVSNAPILNIDPSDNLGLDEQEPYVKNIRKLLEKGYKTYSCRGISYVLDTPVGKQMVVAPKLIDEVQRLPDSIASNAHANELIMQFRHTLDGRLMHDHFHVDMPIKKLTNSLGPKLPDIVEEAQLAIDKFIGSPTEWTPHKIMPLSFNIVTRTANRLLFGTQLTRNDDFLKLSIDYTTIMFGAANRIRNYPELLKPIILRLSTNIKQAQAEARRHLIPVIESRLKQMKEYCEAGRAEYWDKIKPDDAIQWVLDAAPPDGMDPKILVFRMLHINIAAVHTSTVNFVDIVQVLAMMPDIQTELREEIQSEFLKGEDGPSKA
ncbi:hypothetical protein FDECE_10224 [Fusarium decemcellulare]|nr:hypothetical protein FDECE_10224 [Fusarium decemcellulare]